MPETTGRRCGALADLPWLGRSSSFWLLACMTRSAAHQAGLSQREVAEIGGHRGLSALERHLDGHGYLCRFLEPLRYILLI